MNNKPRKAKARTVIVQAPKLRPKISYPKVTIPVQEHKLVRVRVRVKKENTDANPKNKGTKAQGRSS